MRIEEDCIGKLAVDEDVFIWDPHYPRTGEFSN